MTTLKMFHEVSLPRTIADGSTFGPSYSTDIVNKSGSGEQRNINWEYPKCQGTINMASLIDQDFQQLLIFFHCRRGQAYGFRFYDYSDHTGTFELLGFGDGGTTNFQLIKNYIQPEIDVCTKRKILKPIAGTTRIFFKAFTAAEVAAFTWQKQADIRTVFSAGIPDGSEQQLNWSIDTTTGIVTFNSAPASNVAIIASYQFEVPVRFATDDMPANWHLVDAEQWGNIPIIELKS